MKDIICVAGIVLCALYFLALFYYCPRANVLEAKERLEKDLKRISEWPNGDVQLTDRDHDRLIQLRSRCSEVGKELAKVLDEPKRINYATARAIVYDYVELIASIHSFAREHGILMSVSRS